LIALFTDNKIDMKRTVLFLLATAIYVLPLAAEVSFSELHLSQGDRLLFSATTDSPVYGSFSTLLDGDLAKNSFRQLTFFPEQVALLERGNRLQIRNRFGVFRSGPALEGIESATSFPGFTGGSDIVGGKLLHVSSSPDGRYLVYFEPVSYAYADLYLYDVDREDSFVVSRSVEIGYDTPPALWSGGSDFFMYHKGGSVYYFSMEQKAGDRIIDESYREIGPGELSSVTWSQRNELYYIRRNLVYRILGSEFFARSIYGGLLDIGTIVGKVPFVFNPSFDSIVMSPDGRKLLYNRGGRSLFLYFLQTDDYLAQGGVRSLPYLLLPRNTRVQDVLWSSGDIITVLTNSFADGGRKSDLYRIDLTGESEVLSFQQFPGSGVVGLGLSPDQKLVAVMRKDGVDLKEYESWKSISAWTHADPMHVLWPSDQELLIAGKNHTEIIDLTSRERRLVSLSQAGSYGFIEDDKVQITLADQSFTLSSGPSITEWTVMEVPGQVKEASTAGTDFRVYLESVTGGSYRNKVMVRSISGFGTGPLFPEPVKRYDPYPEKEEPLSAGSFTHGSRIRRREVALVFNAIDNPEGLTEALQVLDDYDLRTTFFVNGEFIRRNPGAVQELALSRHELGNLFYVYFNMTDARFKVDKDFIKRGLARNEDDFFEYTGKELSLLWHAPYYFVSSDIIAAGEEMNYRYIGRDLDPLDWVPKSDCEGESFYLPSRDIVERVMKMKKPGSIIPVRLGELEDGRGDYLFQHLDLLINALIQEGYSIVPVTTLMEHSR
jgi:peptidoglycan/xylan/chitin deacetylase (PgdA/CDA1 family)